MRASDNVYTEPAPDFLPMRSDIAVASPKERHLPEGPGPHTDDLVIHRHRRKSQATRTNCSKLTSSRITSSNRRFGSKTRVVS